LQRRGHFDDAGTWAADTAIVVIGRSGSAFAAEIGTMKVTEEIDALETMRIDRLISWLRQNLSP